MTYSPFAQNPDSEDYRPPFTFPAGRTRAKINVPRTDQTYTVYVRAIAANIESEPYILKVFIRLPFVWVIF